MRMAVFSRCCGFVVGLFLCVGSTLAALPDPVAFSWAIEKGDIKQVKTWLDEGLDPEFLGSRYGTGLANAAWSGNIEMMQLFLSRGANPRRANRNDEQPLQLAAWNGHLDAVKWLLDHGAVLDREGSHWGALHYAVFNGHMDLAKYLIERGAKINALSPNGSTPLMMAAREGREDMTKILLESGADTHTKNDWGDTALTLAMRYDHYRLGKMISSPEEFEIAVKAPKEDFGVPVRSASAPSEIEELLQKIRDAEAEGRPSEELRARLNERINEIRSQAIAQRNARRSTLMPYQPNSIVITAKRNRFGGERAQITATGRPVTVTTMPAAKQGDKLPVVKVTPVDRRAVQARIAELMRQIRLAEAQGRPSEKLRQELYEAVDLQK